MRFTGTTFVAAVTVSIFASLAVAADTPGLPKEALAAMEFLAGKWISETTENGKDAGGGSDQRTFVEGKYCLTGAGSGIDHGNRIEFHGICGWDAKDKQLVETWYASNGLSVSVRSLFP